MLKKVIGLVLCLSLISTGMLETVSYGAGADRRQAEKAPAGSAAADPFLTVSGIIRQFNVNEEWMDEQLSQGYTLYQIYKALQGGKDGYEKAISRYKPTRDVEQASELSPAPDLTQAGVAQVADSRPSLTAAASDYDQSAIE